MGERMLRTGLVLAALAAAVPPAARGDTWEDYPPPFDEFEPGYRNANRANTGVWLKAAEAPGYAEATAWDPAFEDHAVWPALTGKEKYTGQTWKKAPLLLWAHPGQSAGVRGATHDTYDPANWIDAATGKPPPVEDMRDLLDGTRDFLIPPADPRYQVSWKVPGREHARISIRHLTIGRNASWYTSGIDIHGNVWVKAGGSIGNHGAMSPVGVEHSFFRNDNPYAPVEHREGGYGSHVSQYVVMNKPGATCEFIGAFSMTDEFRVMGGTMIAAVDSEVHPGRNATPIIAPEAALALLDGAFFGKIINQFDTADMICDGTISGGLPDRPLTRDCTFALGYKNWPPVHFSVEPGSERDKEWNRRRTSLVLKEGAKMVVHSTDLSKARMVVKWHGMRRTWAINHYFQGLDSPRTTVYFKDPQIRKEFDSVPPKIDLWCGPGVMLSGLRFEDLRKGGLMHADEATKRSWKDLDFGPSCAGSGEEHYSHVPKVGRSGEY